jgi:hypothetical protein
VRVSPPRGNWIDFWTGERRRGGGELLASAPPESERPPEATLYGEPPLGRAAVRLADRTRIRWRDGEWSVAPKREVRFRHNPGKGGLNGRRADAAG